MSIRHRLFGLTLASLAFMFHLAAVEAADKPEINKVVKLARFKVNDNVSFGVVEGENVREVSGSIFGDWQKTDNVHALSDVI